MPLALYIKINREWYYGCSGVWNFSLTIQLHIHRKVQWTSESLKWEENNSISPRSQFLYDLFHLWYQHLPIKENELILVSCHSSWHQIEQMTCHMKSYCNFPCVEIWFFFCGAQLADCNLMVTSQLAPTHNSTNLSSTFMIPFRITKILKIQWSVYHITAWNKVGEGLLTSLKKRKTWFRWQTKRILRSL